MSETADRTPGTAGDTQATAPVGRIVAVTGMSGAGKTVALKALEDMGYEAVDNLPLGLVRNLIGPNRPEQRPLAFGVDVRTRDFTVESFLVELDWLNCDPLTDAGLVFLECEDEVLRRRYSTTRHRHPRVEHGRLTQAIARERTLLAPLRARASHLIDTSRLDLSDLRRILEHACGRVGAPGLAVSVLSFSYRLGLPPEADIVLDVRFLKNPFYAPRLARLTGRDPAVAAFVEADPGLRGVLRRPDRHAGGALAVFR